MIRKIKKKQKKTKFEYALKTIFIDSFSHDFFSSSNFTHLYFLSIIHICFMTNKWIFIPKFIKVYSNIVLKFFNVFYVSFLSLFHCIFLFSVVEKDLSHSNSPHFSNWRFENLKIWRFEETKNFKYNHWSIPLYNL